MHRKSERRDCGEEIEPHLKFSRFSDSGCPAQVFKNVVEICRKLVYNIKSVNFL